MRMDLRRFLNPRALGVVWLVAMIVGVVLSQWVQAGETAQSRQLLYGFRKAQSEERRALFHRERSELKILKQAQDVRFKEWNNKENVARREYFNTHAGPEKRAYMEDLKVRRAVLQKELKDQRIERAKEMEERLRTQRKDHEERLQQFREALQKGETPSESLWPAR